MNRSWVSKFAGLVLVLTLITTSLVAGTYAKYVTEVTGSDTARVAKFAFNLNAGSKTFNQSDTTEVDFDIFSYTDSGVYNNGVASGGAIIIAPDTAGSIPLEVENLSEVDVTVAFGLTETNAGSIPIYYTLDAGGQRYSDILTGTYDTTQTYQDLDALETAMKTAATKLEASDGTTATALTFTLNWAWAYESAGTQQTDSADTTLGEAGTATVKLAIAVTVTQAD